MIPTLLLTLALKASAPVTPPIFLEEIKVYGAVVSGKTTAERYAVAAQTDGKTTADIPQQYLANWRLTYDSWVTTKTKPSGMPAIWTLDNVNQVWSANTALSIDLFNQTNYTAESDMGYPRFGNTRGEAGLVYVTERLWCPFPTEDMANDFCTKINAMRRIGYSERMFILNIHTGNPLQGWLEPSTDPTDPRLAIVPLPWAFWRTLYWGSKLVYSTTLPPEVLTAPDRSDIFGG